MVHFTPALWHGTYAATPVRSIDSQKNLPRSSNRERGGGQVVDK